MFRQDLYIPLSKAWGKHGPVPKTQTLTNPDSLSTISRRMHTHVHTTLSSMYNYRKGVKFDDLTVALVDVLFHQAWFGREGNGEGSYCLLGILCFFQIVGHMLFSVTCRFSHTSHMYICCADATPRHGAGGKPGGLASQQGGQDASVPRVLLVWVTRHTRHHLAHLGHHEIHCHGPREVSAPH